MLYTLGDTDIRWVTYVLGNMLYALGNNVYIYVGERIVCGGGMHWDRFYMCWGTFFVEIYIRWVTKYIR